MGQRLTDRVAQTEPSREPGRDLTMLRQAAARAARIGQRTNNSPDPAMHRKLLAEMAYEEARGLGGLAIRIGAIVRVRHAISSPPANTAVSAASDVQPMNRNSAT